jgi:hypothetical protein
MKLCRIPTLAADITKAAISAVDWVTFLGTQYVPHVAISLGVLIQKEGRFQGITP